MRQVRGGVDGDGAQTTFVKEIGPRAAAFGSAPGTIWLQLAGCRALTVEVHWPEAEGIKEVVPAFLVESGQLLGHSLEALRERGQVRDQHRLQLDIRIQPDALQQIGHKELIGVVVQPRAEIIQVEMSGQRRRKVEGSTASLATVPHNTTCPQLQGFLTQCEWSWALPLNVSSRDARCQLVADVKKVCSGGRKPLVESRAGCFSQHCKRIRHAGGGTRRRLRLRWSEREPRRKRNRIQLGVREVGRRREELWWDSGSVQRSDDIEPPTEEWVLVEAEKPSTKQLPSTGIEQTPGRCSRGAIEDGATKNTGGGGGTEAKLDGGGGVGAGEVSQGADRLDKGLGGEHSPCGNFAHWGARQCGQGAPHKAGARCE
eukprot:1572354-Prymnesium_polylepis.1